MSGQDLIQPFTPWQDTTRGGNVYGSKTARFYKTGGWRVDTPILDTSKCINCQKCFLMCPDCSVILTEGKVTGIDYDYCKGCGVCSDVCKVQAITMRMKQEEKGYGSKG